VKRIPDQFWHNYFLFFKKVVMIIKNIWLTGLFLFAGACNNKGKSSAEINSDTVVNSTATVDSLSSGCYSQIIQRDTSFLQLEQNGNTVNGALSYNIFQKDRNDGTLQADLSGDILTGWYLFRSEGIVSVRQVSWKINGNELWPGMGEVIQKNDTTLFAEPDKLQYDNTRPFKKIPCII
jgi:hypothetical protein